MDLAPAWQLDRRFLRPAGVDELRAWLHERVLTDIRVPACEVTMPRAGMVRAGGETFAISDTDVGRLTRYAAARVRQDRLDEELVLRVWKNRVIGVVSPAYVSMRPLQLLDALEEALRGTGLSLRFFGGGWHGLRLVFIDALAKAEPLPGDVSHGGLDLITSETGSMSMRVRGYLLRLVCSNGATVPFSLDETEQMHRGAAPEALVARLGAAAKLAAARVRRHLDALSVMARTGVDGQLERWALARLQSELSERSAKALIAALPDQPSAYDLYNAITSRAHRRGALGRTGLEALGGEVVRRFLGIGGA